MWYPNIRLTRGVRVAFMIFLIACFFIISPLIIFYTAGYRYDRARHEIKETGVITIDPTPQDATIFLNDVLIEKNAPLRLPNRAPGIYSLSISKEGYLPASLSLEVQSRQTTYVNDVVLYHDVLPTFEYAPTGSASQSSVSTNGRFVASIFEKDAGVYEILLKDLTTAQENIVWRGQSESLPDIAWSPYAPLFTIRTKRAEKTLLQKIDARLPLEGTAYELSTTSTPRLQWSNTQPDTLYLSYRKSIDVLQNGTSRSLVPMRDQVWFVDRDQSVWHISDADIVLHNDDRIASLPDGLNTTRILDVTDTYLLLQTARGISQLWLDSHEVTTIQASEAIFRPLTVGGVGSWIAWSASEVYKIDPSGSATLITRTTQPLHEVEVLPVHGALLFAYEHSLVAFHPTYRTTHTLFHTTGELSHVHVDQNGKTIIFDTTINDRQGIYRRQL